MEAQGTGRSPFALLGSLHGSGTFKVLDGNILHLDPAAFEAVIRCCKDYDWDAVVPNMVYVWTGLAQAAPQAIQ